MFKVQVEPFHGFFGLGRIYSQKRSPSRAGREPGEGSA